MGWCAFHHPILERPLAWASGCSSPCLQCFGLPAFPPPASSLFSAHQGDPFWCIISSMWPSGPLLTPLLAFMGLILMDCVAFMTFNRVPATWYLLNRCLLKEWKKNEWIEIWLLWASEVVGTPLDPWVNFLSHTLPLRCLAVSANIYFQEAILGF